MLFNKNRALEYMSRFHLDALVATTPVNITYFTDYYAWLDGKFKEYMMVPGASDAFAQAYSVFPAEGDPALVVNTEFVVNAADLWVHDLHPSGQARLDMSLDGEGLPAHHRRLFEVLQRPIHHGSVEEALIGILKDLGLSDGRIGIESPSAQQLEALRGALPGADVQDATQMILLIRMVKSADELERLTRAAEIAEDAAMAALHTAERHHSIQEVVQVFRERVALGGADFEHFAFGVGGMGIATEPQYRLTDTDMLYIDYGCIYRYCYSDSGTTLTMREPSAVLRQKHAALRDCVIAGFEAMRPGIRSSKVCEAMWSALTERGVTTSFPHGHGVGLELRDYPVIVRDNGRRIKDGCVDVPSDLPLEEDMVLNLESNLSFPGVATVHVERSFVVTKTGARPLIPQDRGEPFLPDSAQ